eukprot:Blabericola_migrator_1__3717@NODE_2112_length_3253_cov_429_439109_g1337_i0_p3_GENE_NODE_2112_length_3253_cov_429_439109_g1337_i0NODE_2112_length_3253_cov_429_439109_g1337_i0_p3_ORF_typecomplete_len176_score42_57_NODE_2112_length_3253_cov_429_439109_g1337_i020572584
MKKLLLYRKFSFHIQLGNMTPHPADEDSAEEDPFTVCIPPTNTISSHTEVPKLTLQSSKSLPQTLPPFATIKPYEAPKSEKLRHKPGLLQVEFAVNDEETPLSEEGSPSSPEQSPIPRPANKKNLKFRQLLAKFQISPRQNDVIGKSDDPLDWLEAPERKEGRDKLRNQVRSGRQ